MQLANQEAHRFNHEYISTEHLLVALVKEGNGVAANVLKRVLTDPLKVIREELERIGIQPGPDYDVQDKLPCTPRTKRIIEYAIDDAKKLGHHYVGTEHLLLGLLREGEGTAAQVLVNLGLDLKTVREYTLNLLGEGTTDKWDKLWFAWRDNHLAVLRKCGLSDDDIDRDMMRVFKMLEGYTPQEKDRG